MADKEAFDLVIVGSGPGGYVAAVKAAQLGLKTACVEKETRLGGVCLNVGCIPSKALLDSSEYYHLAKEQFAAHGIKTGRVSLDLAAMMDRKEQVVAELTKNVQQLLKRHKIAIIKGTATLKAADQVQVSGTTEDNKTFEQILKTKNILLATGSKPIAPPGLEFDGDLIVSSTEALQFDAIPKALGVVGGGYIGLELGSVWKRLGSKVTVLEMLPQIATNLDGQVGRTLKRLLSRQGMEFRLKTKVVSTKHVGQKVRATVESNGKKETLSFDKLLIAVGRKPSTEGLGLETVGVETDASTGCVKVDANYRTSVTSIYAIGDLVAGPMLAHKASAEGIAAVECIAGLPGEVNYDAVPAVIYTWPEVASVGLSEQQLKERNIPYRSGTYPFAGNGRARCMGETDGLAKLLAHQKTGRILGVHIIGPRASEMIAECVLAVELGATAETIARTIHGHPTFAEALQEAAMMASS